MWSWAQPGYRFATRDPAIPDSIPPSGMGAPSSGLLTTFPKCWLARSRNKRLLALAIAAGLGEEASAPSHPGGKRARSTSEEDTDVRCSNFTAEEPLAPKSVIDIARDLPVGNAES